MPSAVLLATVERCRRRVWALAYRMTGSRTDADDLAHEAIARAIERHAQLEGSDPSAVEGWLFRIATTVCLDHLKREKRIRRVTDLVDPIDLPDPAPSPVPADGPEAAVIRRHDVRFAVVVALQALSPRQRVAVILHDVCDRPLDEVAAVLDCNPNAAKALLHRGRQALVRARGRTDADALAEATLVERLARAIEGYATDDLASLLAEDAWGVVDGGGVIPVATKPSFGRRSIVRRWANAARRLGGVPLACEVRCLNGEPAVLVTLPRAGGMPFASVHVETRAGAIAALRVVRDPGKLAPLATPAA
jgi:RNA polymerase sigma-70 factor (ECF subfamily)